MCPSKPREKEIMEHETNFEIPDTKSALVTLPSHHLSPRPICIETKLCNIEPLHFVATDQQLSPRWESLMSPRRCPIRLVINQCIHNPVNIMYNHLFIN